MTDAYINDRLWYYNTWEFYNNYNNGIYDILK